MYIMDKTKIGNWLEKKFLEWQTLEGERKTIGAFSEWLGVHRVLLSRWMNSSAEPDESSADKIADKLGPEIYDLLGLPRPDPRLRAIIAQWGSLPESVKDELVKRAETNQRSTLESTDRVVASAKRG